MPYIGVAPSSGLFKKLDVINVVNAQAAYTMQYNSSNFKPATAEQLIVSVNGVIQAPTDAYTVSGSTITFSENLVTGDVIDFIVALGEVGNTVTPVDGSVDINKMSSSLMTESGGSTTFKVDNIQNSSGTDAVSIDSSGKVGIGTTSPSEKVEILHSSDSALKWSKSGSSYSGYLYQDANGSGVFNAAGVAGEGFYLDRNSQYMYMTTNSTERMRIDSSGRVLFGKTANDWTADGFQFEDGPGMGLTNSITGNNLFLRKNSTTGTMIAFWYNSTSIGSVTSTASSVSYNTSSDYRLKENAVDLTGAITRVKSLQPKRFNFIADDSTTVDGFMAHEAATVVPEAVTGTHNEVDADGNPVYQGIDQSKLVPLLTAALQEAIAKIETLETKVTALENA